jgi:hypothetical protein
MLGGITLTVAARVRRVTSATGIGVCRTTFVCRIDEVFDGAVDLPE